MKQRTTIVATFMAIFLFFGFSNAFGEEKEKVETETYGDWALRCPKGKGVKKGTPKQEDSCVLTQQIMIEKSKSPIVTFVFVYAGKPQTLHAILRAPLGVALPPGLLLQIDEDKASSSNWQFNYCEPGGCLAAGRITPQLRKKFQAGKKAQISFRALNGRTVTVPASLRGVTAGLNALDKKKR